MANTKPKTMTRRLAPMWVPDDFEEKLDELRRHEPDLPPKSEMMRRLVDRAHEKLPGARKRKG